MKWFNRSMLVVCVAGGLSAGAGIAAPAFSGNAPAVRPLEEHWKHPHMHHAMASLKEARSELESAEEIFRGQRDKAIEEVDAAMKHVEAGLREQHDFVSLPSDLPQASHLARFEHMHHARELLHSAREELDSADKIFGGHRDEAIMHVDKAIKHVEEGLHDHEK